MGIKGIPVGGTKVAIEKIAKDLDSNATPENDAFPSGSKTVICVIVDNTLNTTAVYTKFVDATTFTVGTDAPIITLRTPAGKKKRHYLFSPSGSAFDTGISFATVTGKNKASTTSPAAAVIVRVATWDVS